MRWVCGGGGVGVGGNIIVIVIIIIVRLPLAFPFVSMATVHRYISFERETGLA